MARPREFDMDEALDAAMGTFWTKGYESTSMTDLMEATGLHKGSIYKAFEDKHDLFMKSLTRYLDRAYQRMHGILSEATSPVDGLRAWLQGAAALCCDQPVQRGCMAMNAVVELGAHDAKVSALLRRHHARASSLLIETIEQGQRTGQIRSDHCRPTREVALRSQRRPARQLAKSLFVLSAGLLGTSKVLRDTVDADEMVDSAMVLVGLPEQGTAQTSPTDDR